MTSEHALERFVANARSVAAEVTVVEGHSEVVAAAREAIRVESSVYCPELSDLEKRLEIPEELRTSDFANASACIEEAFAAVAETGSLVWTSRAGKPVQAGLLPPHHIAIVDRNRIFATLDELFVQLGPETPTNITFETGPSRTADIELTLTIGVHGPERLTILVA